MFRVDILKQKLVLSTIKKLVFSATNILAFSTHVSYRVYLKLIIILAFSCFN